VLQGQNASNSNVNNVGHSNSDFDSELHSFLTSSTTGNSGNADKIAQVLNSGGNLDSFLSQLWDREHNESVENRQLPMAHAAPSLKRKASTQDVDSTELVEAESSTSNSHQSQLVQNNMLLTQLLSKKDSTPKNKQSRGGSSNNVNPMGCPQDSLPKNTNKIIEVTATSTVEDFKPSVKADSKNFKEVKKTPNSWDNPRTNPNSPFPGNTKDEVKEQKVAAPSTSSTSITNTYENLQQLLSQTSQGSESMDVTSSCSTGGATGTSSAVQFTNSDPLLDNIIQQAQEMQQDLGAQSQQQQQQRQQQQQAQQPAPMDQTNMTDDVTLLSQLEQVLNSSNLSLAEIDNLLGINQASHFNTSSDMSEQMAIDAIQQQLMRDDPMASSSSVVSSTGPPQQQPQPDTTGLSQKSSANSLLLELNPSLDTGAGMQRTSPMVQGAFQQQQAQQVQQAQHSPMNFSQQQQQQQGQRFPQNIAGEYSCCVPDM
jgi:hypothetical protein